MLFLILFLFAFHVNAEALHCESLFIPINSTQLEKLKSLRFSAEKISSFLFSLNEIENRPQDFAEFLERLESLNLTDMNANHLDVLVRTYLKGQFSEFIQVHQGAELRAEDTAEQSLHIMQNLFSQQLRLHLKNEKNLSPSALSKMILIYKMNRSLFKTSAAIAAWLTVSAASHFYAPVPVYLPKLYRGPSKAQMRILVKELPRLTPEKAMQLIQNTVPHSNPLKTYEAFQKRFWKISLAAGLFLTSISPMALHYEEQIPIFGPEISSAEESVRELWDEIFIKDLQDQAIEEESHFMQNPNDPAEKRALAERVRSLPLKELRARAMN